MINLYSYKYDSPIEKLLGEMLYKYVERSTSEITPQFEIHTSRSRFVLDFLITAGQRKYAVECDGKDFHEYYPDLYRDAMLLGEGHINEMIRFRGKDLFSCLNTCVYFLGKLIPSFISERNLSVLDIKAKTERWNLQESFDPEGKGFYDDIFDIDAKEVQDDYGLWRGEVQIICRHDRIDNCSTEIRLPEWAKAYIYIYTNKIPDKETFVEKYPKRLDS